MTNIPHFIHGKKLTGQSDLAVTNPAYGETIRYASIADATTVQQAIDSATTALKEWSALPVLKRVRFLNQFLHLVKADQETLMKLICEEHGKTMEDAAGEIARGLEVVEFALGIPHVLKGEHSEQVGPGIDSYSMHQPVGVCLGITPFNFPAMVPMWMFPVALACGNTFILKPSEKDPSASVFMAEKMYEAGVPAGVLNVVQGDKSTVQALMASPQIKAVSFVGSTPVAKSIYQSAAQAGKRVQALGGAKNHVIVMPDADLEQATSGIMGAAFGSTGQRCMAISVVVAVGDIADSLVESLTAAASKLVVGPGHDHATQLAPLHSLSHKNNVVKAIDTGVEQGATLVLDGRDVHIDGYEQGYFVGPTVFDNVTTYQTIYQQEIFGPVLCIIRAKTYQEAISLVNAHPSGNGSAIYTNQGHIARDFVQSIEAGMVGINVPIPVPIAYHSFGGWKESLFGDLHMHGPDGVKFYTRLKTATCRWPTATSEQASFAMPLYNEA